MRAFLMVHQLGSFTKAAEQLHITQAGLSALIKELEAQLGSRLFERTTRRVSLTPQGLIFLPVVQHMDQQLASVVRAIGDYDHQAQRTLRIAASPVMVNGILPLVLKRHAIHHPDDIIELIDVARQDVLPEVEQGNADLGMGLFLRQVSGLKFFRIFSTALMLVSPIAGAHEPAPLQSSIDWADVPADALIRLSQDNPLQQWIDSRLLAAGNPVMPNARSRRFHNIESCIAMVEMGQGHFIAPDFVVPVCKRYSVALRSIASPDTSVDFYVIQRAGASLGAVARDFVDSCLQALADSAIGTQYNALQPADFVGS